MTHAELAKYRAKLNALVRRIGMEQSSLRHEALGGEAGLSPGEVPVDQADMGIAEIEEETAQSVLQTEEEILGECEAALERIARGTYGKCVACGGLISHARLDSLPYARKCVACERRIQS